MFDTGASPAIRAPKPHRLRGRIEPTERPIAQDDVRIDIPQIPQPPHGAITEAQEPR